MSALVIGAGVAGLSCAVRLLEAGYAAQVWARELPPQTTSNVAAAVWYPYRAYPEELVGRWGARAYAEFVRLAAEQPASGVVLRQGSELFAGPVADPWWRDAVPGFRRAAPDELPPDYRDGYVFAAPVIDMSVYMDYLLARVRAAGGQVLRRGLASLDEAFAAHRLVVNCAGLGARELVGDASMVPIRGQVVRVAPAGPPTFVIDDHNPRGVTYIIPRLRDCVLGGVAEEGRELLEPEPATAAAIVERCAALRPELASAAVLEHRVGLRPGRPTVRLEAEPWPGGGTLIHNYGHGGAGVTLSWGCADDVLELAAAALRPM